MTKDIVRILDNADLTAPVDLAHARALFADIRAAHGFAHRATNLLGDPDVNEKLDKSTVATFSLSLAQADTSGYNVCRYSTPGCRSVCVAQNGNGAFSSVKRGRAAKTVFLAEHPAEFVALLTHEIRTVARRPYRVAFRLNAFSDIPWERYLPADVFTLGEFYDYTKWTPDVRPLPADYSLVRSITERHTDADILNMVAIGEIPVVVFDAPRYNLPDNFHGIPVVDGDVTDQRFDNLPGTVVGLAIKPRKRDARASGFARAV